MDNEKESNNSHISGEEEQNELNETETIQNYIPPKQKAIKFVTFENGKFIISEEAKKLLSQKDNENIGIISLVGKYRTGKSFLLNRISLP